MSTAPGTALSNTVVGRWYTRLAGNPSTVRNHWQTKEIYFRAAAGLVAASPGEPLTWKRIVAAAQPRGCRSTFYEVAGSHARHRMIDELIRDGSTDAIQLALRYRRSDAVEQLLDETKVWSYWAYRERLLARLAQEPVTEEAACDALTHTLLAWARQHAPLAAALDYSPPACAVEDLVVIRDGRLAATRAAGTLTDLMRHAV